MTLPASGQISMSQFSTEMGQASTYSASLSWINDNTLAAQRPATPNMGGYYNKAWFQNSTAGNCNNGNCTSNCNCGNIQCTNCYISGTVNCANCDTRSWLQNNCNCACTYNCSTGEVSYNCNCNCDCNTCFPAGVMVLMYDRTWKPIEQIVASDILMGIYGNPETIEKIDTPLLGSRRMMSFAEDRATNWSEEHPFWARKDGKEWFAAANPDSWIHEVNVGSTVGLKDNYSMLELAESEVATLKGFEKRTLIDVTHEFEQGYLTQLYFPVTKSHMPFIVGNYVSTGGTDEFTADYTSISWESASKHLKDLLETQGEEIAI